MKFINSNSTQKRDRIILRKQLQLTSLIRRRPEFGKHVQELCWTIGDVAGNNWGSPEQPMTSAHEMVDEIASSIYEPEDGTLGIIDESRFQETGLTSRALDAKDYRQFGQEMSKTTTNYLDPIRERVTRTVQDASLEKKRRGTGDHTRSITLCCPPYLRAHPT